MEPNHPEQMHEQHTVYRVEVQSRWNLHPGTASFPLPTGVGVLTNAAFASAPLGAGGNAASTDVPTFRNNPDVDAKIDAHIRENPKYWAYIQAMPRDRLERTVVLNELRELDRQQRLCEGVLKQVNRNPELKRAYDLLVKDLPEGAIAQIQPELMAGDHPASANRSEAGAEGDQLHVSQG